MKNVTITLDEQTVTWARRQAADQDMSLSRFIGTLLENTMRDAREYERSMRQYLARKPAKIKKRGAQYPRREDLHDRDSFR